MKYLIFGLLISFSISVLATSARDLGSDIIIETNSIKWEKKGIDWRVFTVDKASLVYQPEFGQVIVPFEFLNACLEMNGEPQANGHYGGTSYIAESCVLKGSGHLIVGSYQNSLRKLSSSCNGLFNLTVKGEEHGCTTAKNINKCIEGEKNSVTFSCRATSRYAQEYIYSIAEKIKNYIEQ